jgi:hypothetical protein
MAMISRMSVFTVKGDGLAWAMAGLYLAPLKNARSLPDSNGAAAAW